MHWIATPSTEQGSPDRDDAAPACAAHEAGRLVLDALRRSGSDGAEFLRRRARREARELVDRRTARVLCRVLDAFSRPEIDADRSAGILLEWAGRSEGRGDLNEAAAILSHARELKPECPELALHAGRVARRSGRTNDARALYRRVRELDREAGRLSRMADVGLALVSSAPEVKLGRALEGAVEAGDQEAAAVAREGLAELRRRAGRTEAALEDYGDAGVLFRDPRDRGRVALRAAELLLEAERIPEARQALRMVAEWGHPGPADRARGLLRELARAQGDELGLRRWDPAGDPAGC